jgi:threonine/homoserine/homoserine lactone efflux protein
MKTSTRIFGWAMATILSLLGLSAITNHRFTARHGAGLATGYTADILGALMLIGAAYLIYVLRSSRHEKSAPDTKRDGAD